jgi:pyruvate/oxaloacetate carboxyltransferase
MRTVMLRREGAAKRHTAALKSGVDVCDSARSAMVRKPASPATLSIVAFPGREADNQVVDVRSPCCICP